MTNDAEHQLTATRASLVTSSSVPEARTRRAGDARWETALPHDSVDALISSWRRRRPDLDFSALRVISRLTRVSSHVDAALEQVLGDYGVSRTSFHALVTLERLGGERGVNQRRLMDELGLTSGTISLRMDRLADAGLIERLPDPESRRSTLIALTARGHELFERAKFEHAGQAVVGAELVGNAFTRVVACRPGERRG